VIFLDIQMPGESGLVLAREISRLREPPLIVFVTAYSEHAVDAFEVHALDYLLKPLNDARLAQTVERIGAMLGQRQREAYGAALRDYVDAGAGKAASAGAHQRALGRPHRADPRGRHPVDRIGRQLRRAAPGGRTVLHRITLNRLEALLAPADFLRVHRGAIVRRRPDRAPGDRRRRQLPADAALRRRGGGQRTLPGRAEVGDVTKCRRAGMAAAAPGAARCLYWLIINRELETMRLPPICAFACLLAPSADEPRAPTPRPSAPPSTKRSSP
jgi:hypothetical protein